MPRAALVILNKNSREGLEKTLESLSTQSCPPCECFDIYIVDGGSSDGSIEAARTAGRRMRCIYWLEQGVPGGTGPARIEILEILRRRGYRHVIWGDSENTYSPEYVERILRLLERGCDFASGRSVVVNSSRWSEAFFWYHAFHNIFPRLVGSKHSPGNNVGARMEVYESASYPPSSRSEDYIFTFSLLLKGYRKRFCIDREAVVMVRMARSFREVVAWQRSRVSGLVQGSIYIGLPIPPDLLNWLAPIAILIAAAVSSAVLENPGPVTLSLTAMATLAAFLHSKASDHLDRRSRLAGILGLAGMILHAVFTTIYSIKGILGAAVRGRRRVVEDLRALEARARELGMRRDPVRLGV